MGVGVVAIGVVEGVGVVADEDFELAVFVVGRVVGEAVGEDLVVVTEDVDVSNVVEGDVVEVLVSEVITITVVNGAGVTGTGVTGTAVIDVVVDGTGVTCAGVDGTVVTGIGITGAVVAEEKVNKCLEFDRTTYIIKRGRYTVSLDLFNIAVLHMQAI